jgi:hypothetical protein
MAAPPTPVHRVVLELFNHTEPLVRQEEGRKLELGPVTCLPKASA